jgi:hypothetical protein
LKKENYHPLGSETMQSYKDTPMFLKNLLPFSSVRGTFIHNYQKEHKEHNSPYRQTTKSQKVFLPRNM